MSCEQMIVILFRYNLYTLTRWRHHYAYSTDDTFLQANASELLENLIDSI